jgi:hypothetical protein
VSNLALYVQERATRLRSDTINVGGKPYLTRYYEFGCDRKYGNIYIHHFHASDQGDELHNHPWWFGLSYIVSGGYIEEYRVGNQVKKKLVAPGTFNVVSRSHFHRVDLLDEINGAWSIFVAGPRITRPPEWGFWNRHTGEFKDWRLNPEAIP